MNRRDFVATSVVSVAAMAAPARVASQRLGTEGNDSTGMGFIFTAGEIHLFREMIPGIVTHYVSKDMINWIEISHFPVPSGMIMPTAYLSS